jgi:hypothetical protein
MSVASGPARLFWILCFVFGVGVMGLAAWFAGTTPARLAAGSWRPGTSPFLAFQLARTIDDIEAVFGRAGDPCRTGMVAALDLANKVDLIAFIGMYTGFLACFFLALRRPGFVGLAGVGLVATAVACLSDVLETSTQLYITSYLPGPVTSLVFLAIGSTGKFLGIAVAAVCAGAAMLVRGGILGQLAGAACVAGGLMVTVGLNYSPARPALRAGIVIAWLVMSLYAAVAAMRRAPSRE